MDFGRVNIAEKGMGLSRRALGVVKVDENNNMLEEVIASGYKENDFGAISEEVYREDKAEIKEESVKIENRSTTTINTAANPANINNGSSEREEKLMNALAEYRKKVLISELKSAYQAYTLFKSLSKTLNNEQLGEIVKNYFEDLTDEKNKDIMSL